jgi:secreted Zn-dependent insulinase-like peptidase
MLQVTKDLMIPDHPWAKFSTGNVKTLASGDAEKNKFEVTKAMREFHVKHYKPENMVCSQPTACSYSHLWNYITNLKNAFRISQFEQCSNSCLNRIISTLFHLKACLLAINALIMLLLTSVVCPIYPRHFL